MRKDVEYEKLTQEIYQYLLEQDGLTVDVKHNVKLEGRESNHQIDVYWEYTFAGVNHKVAIECKDYNKAISIGKVRDFHAALLDIGNTNGIMVTKMGYQKGAIKYAEGYGINLRVLREPQDDDLKGLMMLTINTKIEMDRVSETNIMLDSEWCKGNHLISVKEFTLKYTGLHNALWIVDDKNNKLETLLQLRRKPPSYCEEKPQLKHVYQFDNRYVNMDEYGLMKLKEIHFVIENSIFETKKNFDIDVSPFIKAIIKDITTGEIKFIKNTLQ